MYYYDIHVLLSRTSGYSIGLASQTELTDDEAIAEAVKQNRFENVGDDDSVDDVTPISAEHYKEIFGEV